MQMETVLVTGASGFIGYALCERLAASYSVIGFDRPGVPHPPPTAHRIDVDLSSEESVTQAFISVREKFGTSIASVIHLAAYYDFSGKPSTKYDEITVGGTERLLRHLKNFQVGQFIFSSTMLVHRPSSPGHPINEDSPLEPKWDYPKSKVKTEDLIKQNRGGIPVLLARVAGVYDDKGHSIPLENQIQRIRERRLTSRVFPGDMSHGQSFIHLDDVVEFFARSVELREKLPPELALLVGEETVLSYITLQREFGKLIHGKEWKTYRIPKVVAKLGAWLQQLLPFMADPFIKPWMIDLADDHYELDITRAKKLLGWQPAHSLKETLPRMVSS